MNRSKSKFDIGDAAEGHQAKRLGATRTPASGALLGAKGDMELNDFRIETKATNSVSYRLTLDDLLKIRQEALEHNQAPAFSIQFVTTNGKPRPNGSWVMIPEYVFQELTIENSKNN